MHPSGKLFYHTRRIDLFRIYQYLALACNGFLSNINIPFTRAVSIRKATVHLLEYLTPFVLHWLWYIYAIITSDHGITMTSALLHKGPVSQERSPHSVSTAFEKVSDRRDARCAVTSNAVETM